MTDVYLGLGSNLGERLEMLAEALRLVDGIANTHVVCVSSVYETEPWGTADQPDYANAVALVRTTLGAADLLGALQGIEDSLGRVRAERYGARTIDIDILLFGDEEWASEDLVIPHPRMLEREFVVVPLLEITPEVRLPDTSPVTRDAAVSGRIVRRLGAVPGFEDRSPREEWVEVAISGRAGRLDRAPDFTLLFYQTVLEEEGIPYAYDPFAPTENFNPWGLTSAVRLLVPASYAARAKDLIAAAAAAPLLPPE